MKATITTDVLTRKNKKVDTSNSNGGDIGSDNDNDNLLDFVDKMNDFAISGHETGKKLGGHAKRFTHTTLILQGLTAAFGCLTFLTSLIFGILILRKEATISRKIA